ncbi:Phosphatidylserine decarboxylase proenzyme 3 [Escovopsis weberi]|uniref:Phosphatidylserine decarboxylase proenzyme 3 n=1 Tax=Escovopsis weberi TaxID=150374 RepID=A0A0M8N5F9_ESCWE|nr:Phosphatidylserine decarboxylase proenzyme 3 [Escovopsis weberi]
MEIAVAPIEEKTPAIFAAEKGESDCEDTGCSPITHQPWKPLDEIHYHPIILLFINQINISDLEKAVASAFKQIPDVMKRFGIRNALGFLRHANDVLSWVPTEDLEAKNIYEVLILFTFVLNQPPLKDLQTPVHPSQVGKPLTWLSNWMVVYTQLIGLFMDTPDSLTEQSLRAFMDHPLLNMEEVEVPEGGWRTFNEFFARRLKPGSRPLAGPDDDRTIVYPADCLLSKSLDEACIAQVDGQGLVHIKAIPWTIESLLQDCRYRDSFNGGVWMHAFLNTFNYHRQHAPVSGRVLEAKVIPGAVSLQASARGGVLGLTCEMDPDNYTAFQFLQARGCIVIENPVVGKVAILPVGMTQVSSVRLRVKAGDVVEKGQEISYFQFGGSDIVCVFERRAGLRLDDFVTSAEGSFSKVNSVLAIAPAPSE